MARGFGDEPRSCPRFLIRVCSTSHPEHLCCGEEPDNCGVLRGNALPFPGASEKAEAPKVMNSLRQPLSSAPRKPLSLPASYFIPSFLIRLNAVLSLQALRRFITPILPAQALDCDIFLFYLSCRSLSFNRLHFWSSPSLTFNLQASLCLTFLPHLEEMQPTSSSFFPPFPRYCFYA